jgi:hypothetical protein
VREAIQQSVAGILVGVDGSLTIEAKPDGLLGLDGDEKGTGPSQYEEKRTWSSLGAIREDQAIPRSDALLLRLVQHLLELFVGLGHEIRRLPTLDGFLDRDADDVPVLGHVHDLGETMLPDL